MNKIQSADSIFCKVAEVQEPFSGKARQMKFVFRQSVDDGVLLFNAISCELLHLDKKEYGNILEDKTLREKWFVVPEDFDDRLFVQQTRHIVKFINQKERITGYTILTTTDCNARCFYCYEKGRSRIPMSKDTAKKVAAYIIGNYNNQKGKKHDVQIGWFGGEPLYNLKVIDSICTDLKKAEVPYQSSMISNGYLFSPEVIAKAKLLWHLRNVQITLDGTEGVYNRCKAYYRVKGSPYQRVLDNIQLLLDAEIHVSIRMNLDTHNADNLMELADELRERFIGNKYLSAYSHPLFEESDHVSSADERPQVNALNERLMDKLKKIGLNKVSGLPKTIALNSCMSDNENSIIIAPTGELGKCEHYTDSDFFSHIDHPEQKDEAMLQKFAEQREKTSLCEDCPYYPLCIRLKVCSDVGICNEYSKSSNIRKIHENMLSAYEKYMKEKKEKEESRKEYKTFPLLGKYVAIGKDDSDNVTPNVITLNETGKEIFEMYISGRSQRQMVAALLEEYDATEQQISEIAKDFTENLSKMISD